MASLTDLPTTVLASGSGCQDRPKDCPPRRLTVTATGRREGSLRWRRDDPGPPRRARPGPGGEAGRGVRRRHRRQGPCPAAPGRPEDDPPRPGRRRSPRTARAAPRTAWRIEGSMVDRVCRGYTGRHGTEERTPHVPAGRTSAASDPLLLCGRCPAVGGRGGIVGMGSSR